MDIKLGFGSCYGVSSVRFELDDTDLALLGLAYAEGSNELRNLLGPDDSPTVDGVQLLGGLRLSRSDIRWNARIARRCTSTSTLFDVVLNAHSIS